MTLVVVTREPRGGASTQGRHIPDRASAGAGMTAKAGDSGIDVASSRVVRGSDMEWPETAVDTTAYSPPLAVPEFVRRVVDPDGDVTVEALSAREEVR